MDSVDFPMLNCQTSGSRRRQYLARGDRSPTGNSAANLARLRQCEGSDARVLEGDLIRACVGWHSGQLRFQALLRTPLWESAADAVVPAAGKDREAVLQNLANQFLALKRFGRVEEVSGLVAFLASERASFMTGSQYDVDGGVPSRFSSGYGEAIFLG
jgi:hypothetical protein